MQNLQLDQQQGNASTTKSNKDKEFEIPATETHLVHARLENVSFNPVTGEKTSKPFVQSFYPREFDQMEANKNFAGMKVEILHDPRSDKEAKADKIATMATSGVADMTLEKPLDQMNRAELQKKYASMYQQEPEAGLNDKALREAITEKIEFIRGEEAAANVNNANENTGIVAGKGGAANTNTADKKP